MKIKYTRRQVPVNKALVFLLTLTLVFVQSCTRHASVMSRRTATGHQAYHPVHPHNLSTYIRAVLKISEEKTAGQDAASKKLLAENPELAALAGRVESDPADSAARLALARGYLEAGLLSSAHHEFSMLSSATPNAETEIGLSEIWTRWGDLALATQYVRSALNLQPDSVPAWEQAGRLALRGGDAKAAASAFDTALRFRPSDPVLLANLGYSHLLAGEWDAARVSLQKAVDLDGSLVQARNNLGIVLAQLGQKEPALAQFSAVSDRATALNNLGVVYLENRDWSEASTTFREAVALKPDYSKAQENLSQAESMTAPPAVIMLPSAPSPDPAPQTTNQYTSSAAPDTRAGLNMQRPVPSVPAEAGIQPDPVRPPSRIPAAEARMILRDQFSVVSKNDPPPTVVYLGTPRDAGSAGWTPPLPPEAGLELVTPSSGPALLHSSLEEVEAPWENLKRFQPARLSRRLGEIVVTRTLERAFKDCSANKESLNRREILASGPVLEVVGPHPVAVQLRPSLRSPGYSRLADLRSHLQITTVLAASHPGALKPTKERETSMGVVVLIVLMGAAVGAVIGLLLSGPLGALVLGIIGVLLALAIVLLEL
ncbi:MAG: hypothetical protein EHM61_00620 [Acidobacteria bacterium]|nr:MAG: hypothetical protein EHM61_00620 [Acidobacteriota bacterium]